LLRDCSTSPSTSPGRTGWHPSAVVEGATTPCQRQISKVLHAPGELLPAEMTVRGRWSGFDPVRATWLVNEPTRRDWRDQSVPTGAELAETRQEDLRSGRRARFSARSPRPFAGFALERMGTNEIEICGRQPSQKWCTNGRIVTFAMCWMRTRKTQLTRLFIAFTH